MKRITSYISFCTGSLLLIGLIASCKKMDEYKKYSESGEIRYPATLDSLKVIPGNHRAMIYGLLTSDPSVKKMRIFWKSGSDSLEVILNRTNGVDTVRQVINNLPEGPMTFTVRTYDEKGNRSIPMNITGNVYGESFQSSVDQRGNRVVFKSIFTMDGSAQITWANVDAYVNVLGMQINYYDANDIPRKLIVPVKLKDQVTTVPSVSVKRAITYNTLYLPEPVGIDTFTVPVNTLPAFTEVTLLNAAPPVANVANDGNRWATPRDWFVNAAAKNHNGYGGTDIGQNSKIYFEAGWGAPAIQNGKIYQVATLPPGKYSFEGSVDWWNVGSRNDVYLIAAQGTNGLPDVSNAGASIANKKLDNWSYIKMPFELTQPTTLSIGLLLYMNDDGEAIRFNHLKIFITN